MGANTGIEWTDSTWNPVTGCSKVSTGCDNCYAAELAARRLKDTYLRRLPVVETPDTVRDPFAVRLWPERLDQPRSWSEPRMVFVNSMSDLFHLDVPEEFVREIFEVMLSEDRHTFQVLTKRPSRAVRFFERNVDLFPDREVPGHIWMGTSVENQAVAHRIRQISLLPAVTRFLSCEPLLGPLSFDLTGIHWVVVGGESGNRHRPMDASWATAIRDACLAAGVSFFFKQVGGRTPKANGKLLEGREWSQLPRVRELLIPA